MLCPKHNVVAADNVGAIIDQIEKNPNQTFQQQNILKVGQDANKGTKNHDQKHLENQNKDLSGNTKTLFESYAGMVGDKRQGKGLTLDIILEPHGEGSWLLLINGNNIENDKLVRSYLQITPSRFLIDVNVNILQDKVVNFTYQMPQDIRLRYGQQEKGYRIAIDLPSGTAVTTKKVSKNEIVVKLFNKDIFDAHQKMRQKKNNANPNNIKNSSGTVYNEKIMNDGVLYKVSKEAEFRVIKLNHPKPLIVAIDAGHGGIDPGARSVSGKNEKQITIMYAKSLAKALKKYNVKVVMTREGDKSVALTERVKIAQQSHADLFVSLHADAHDNPKISGTTVYRLSHLDGKHPDWQRFYNKNYLPKHYENYVDNHNILDILVGLTHHTLLEKSSMMVDNILLLFYKEGVCKICRHGQRSFAVLRGLDMISILIEIGYISNASEEKKLLLASNIEKFSKILADVIVKSFDV